MLQPSTIEKLNAFFCHHKPLQYKPRTIISHPNDIQSSIFYIKSGYLRVFRISEQGEELTLTILKPKDFFPLTYGMNVAVHTNTYYLETITPLEIWKVRTDQFLTFVKSDMDIYVDLAERVIVHFDTVLHKMEYLVLNNAYTKIATTLISCAKKFGQNTPGGVTILVPLTHKDIATLIGITRETTSLEMKKLEKQGFVSRKGKLLTVTNVAHLEEHIYLQTGAKNLVYNTL